MSGFPVQLPAGLFGSWWWQLPPDQFRCAVAIAAMLTPDRQPVQIAIAHIAAIAAVSNRTVMRTLEAMRDARAIAFDARAGRGARAEIRPTFLPSFRDQQVQDVERGNSDQARRPADFPAEFPPSFAQQDQPITASARDAADFSSQTSRRSETGKPEETKQPADFTSGPATPDKKGSSDQRDQGENTEIKNTSSSQPTPKKQTGVRVSADRIPDRAWKAADYLREQVLKEQPTAAIRRQKWEPGQRDGLRLKWADTLRLLHEQDGRAWDEIAQVCYWLFHKQPAGVRFIVQSPDALREKWDRIQAVRTREHTARGPGGHPDPQAKTQFKPWGPDGQG